MADPSKKRKRAKHKSKKERSRRERPQQRSAASRARLVKPDLHREIRNIVRLARAEDSRVVTLGSLVLFSTRTRDAWLLDREDGFALCLCRDGEPQPFQIIDTPDAFSIEWAARFAIDGALFIAEEPTGRVVAIHGYPAAEIAAACRR
jgi:hypothetical protein